ILPFQESSLHKLIEIAVKFGFWSAAGRSQFTNIALRLGAAPIQESLPGFSGGSVQYEHSALGHVGDEGFLAKIPIKNSWGRPNRTVMSVLQLDPLDVRLVLEAPFRRHEPPARFNTLCYAVPYSHVRFVPGETEALRKTVPVRRSPRLPAFLPILIVGAKELGGVVP